MTPVRERKAVHANVSSATAAVWVPGYGLELLRGRERFFLDAREVKKLMAIVREGE